MVSIFFKKSLKSVFFVTSLCSTVLRKPQKWFNFFFNFFRKCMKIVWQAFSPYTWCMELYDKHFRCMEVQLFSYNKTVFFQFPSNFEFHFWKLPAHYHNALKIGQTNNEQTNKTEQICSAYFTSNYYTFSQSYTWNKEKTRLLVSERSPE